MMDTTPTCLTRDKQYSVADASVKTVELSSVFAVDRLPMSHVPYSCGATRL